jgi:nucleoside-diphosphate-sugar epimerase
VANPLDKDLGHILEHGAGDLAWLAGKRLFITGGTGFIGLWLLETIVHANRVSDLGIGATVLTRNPEAVSKSAPHLFSDPALEFVAGNILDFEFPAGDFDIFIHGATTTARETYNDEDPLQKFETVALGTRRALEFSAIARPEKFIYLGSGACYGRQPADMKAIPEEYPGAPDAAEPNSALGIGKRTAEFFCRYFGEKHQLDVSIARCFSFYGPFLPLDIHYAVGNFVADGLAGREIRVAGDGTAIRSYLYVADLIVWLLAILARGRALEAYNAGSDQEVSIRELAEQVGSYFGQPVVVAGSPPGGAPNRYIPAIDKAVAELGVSELIDFETGLDRMITHVRAVPGFYFEN